MFIYPSIIFAFGEISRGIDWETDEALTYFEEFDRAPRISESVVMEFEEFIKAAEM